MLNVVAQCKHPNTKLIWDESVKCLTEQDNMSFSVLSQTTGRPNLFTSVAHISNLLGSQCLQAYTTSNGHNMHMFQTARAIENVWSQSR